MKRLACSNSSFANRRQEPFENRYGQLSMPVSIVVGADDHLIDAKSQSMRLHRDISGSVLHVVSGLGHMVHYGARREVMNAIQLA